ncbi:MAG: dephospho-CoA kinase [Dehalococcoidia bacterium]|nr:MAG: dephospho-CoA kinase [Dehalococcoidia bacterium]
MKMIVIGLTGGILTGKSTVSEMLAQRGAVIIDADKIGHEAYEPHTETWQQVIETFGREILKENGEIDRKKLGEIVFSNPQALARLNEIMHPQMHSMMREEIERLRGEGVEVVVLEAAVLIEANWTDLVDEVWVTIAPEATAIQRLRNRTGLSEDQARARIRSQLSSEERAKHADVIIDTDCELAEVEANVEELWQRLHAHNKGVA